MTDTYLNLAIEQLNKALKGKHEPNEALEEFVSEMKTRSLNYSQHMKLLLT